MYVDLVGVPIDDACSLARPTTCFYSTTRPLACDGTNNQFYWLQKERGKELYEGDLVLVWAFK